MRLASIGVVCVGVAAGACGVPADDPSTGGVDVGEGGACSRGVAVVGSDYQATNVSLVAYSGAVQSESFFSTGSATPGLSQALGGDVVLPTVPAGGQDLLLIDRYPASVLTWVDLATARVSRQLSVATGFAANPRDVATVSRTRAYVSRFERNADPGREPWDAGDDVLVIDPSAAAIVGRIPLGEALGDRYPTYLPRADRLFAREGELLVVLGVYTPDLLDSLSAHLVRIDLETEQVRDVLVLEGLYGCAGLAVSPDATEVSLGCSGRWQGGSEPVLAESGIVRITVSGPLAEVGRISAEDLGSAPVSEAIAYADSTHLVVATYGQFASAAAPARGDGLLEIDLADGGSRVLLEATGEPFTLGSIHCDADCGACFVADAAAAGGVVHRFEVLPGGLGASRAVVVDTRVGLPPRRVAAY